MIEITQRVKIYEVNGEELPITPAPFGKERCLEVKSHWNNNDFVIICTSRGHALTVDGEDLIKAIQNAMNT